MHTHSVRFFDQIHKSESSHNHFFTRYKAWDILDGRNMENTHRANKHSRDRQIPTCNTNSSQEAAVRDELNAPAPRTGRGQEGEI